MAVVGSEKENPGSWPQLILTIGENKEVIAIKFRVFPYIDYYRMLNRVPWAK